MGIGPVEIAGAKIRRIASAPLSIDKDGHVGEAEIDITIRIANSVYISNAARLNNAWGRQADVSGRLDFVEQTQLFEESRKTAESNGHDADAKLTGITPIGGKAKSKKGAETPA